MVSTARLQYAMLAAVVLALVALALLLGKRAVTGSETEVIKRVAQRYVAEAGGTARQQDCAARPAQSAGLWLVVTCRPATGPGIEYFIDRFGRVVHVEDGHGDAT